MSKDILDEFGPNTNTHQKPRASSGGRMEKKEIPYDPPKGPTTFYHEGPGLAAHKNHGNAGTQGHHMGGGHEEGKPGLGGSDRIHGSEHKLQHGPKR